MIPKAPVPVIPPAVKLSCGILAPRPIGVCISGDFCSLVCGPVGTVSLFWFVTVSSTSAARSIDPLSSLCNKEFPLHLLLHFLFFFFLFFCFFCSRGYEPPAYRLIGVLLFPFLCSFLMFFLLLFYFGFPISNVYSVLLGKFSSSSSMFDFISLFDCFPFPLGGLETPGVSLYCIFGPYWSLSHFVAFLVVPFPKRNPHHFPVGRFARLFPVGGCLSDVSILPGIHLPSIVVLVCDVFGIHGMFCSLDLG